MAELLTPVPAVAPALAAISADPALAAARALHVASEAWSTTYQPWSEILAMLDPRGDHDWGDSAAVARAALGGAAAGTIRDLEGYEARLAALEDGLAAAAALFRRTRATSELAAAAMRAAVRRYVKRPGGRAGDGAVLLGELPAA